MTTDEFYKQISSRLFNENICTTPLNKRSLAVIAEYMMLRNAWTDVRRRLSAIEENYRQIDEETAEACQNAEIAKNSISQILRETVDSWANNGALNSCLFDYDDFKIKYIEKSFIQASETIISRLKIISDVIELLGETAAQIRACAMSFTEVSRDIQLAVYAAALNKSKEDITDCRSMYLEARVLASECENAYVVYLGKADICSKLIIILNTMIKEVMIFLDMPGATDSDQLRGSPLTMANRISKAIVQLDNIKLEICE